MRAALYHRVSTTDQDPTLARETLENAARLRGYEVTHVIEETGSGAKQDRPGLHEVLALARQRRIKAVFVWALDRFGRSTLDLLGNIEELHKYGVSFISVHQHLEAHPDADPASMMMLRVLAAVAQFERDMIRARTKQGMIKAQRYGTKSGKLIGGQYQHARTFSLEHKLIAELRSEGHSQRQIAERLGCSRSEVRKVLAWQEKQKR